MKEKVTLSIDGDVWRRIEHRAARDDKSVSEWIVSVMEKNLTDEDRDQEIRQRALDRLDRGFHLGGEPLSRREAHVR